MRYLKPLSLVLLLLISSTAFADAQRAKVNYMLHCQGCHTPDGSGFIERGIPNMNGYMGKFLHVPGGREFLIQVPGASQSLLSSQELAEMTNWMLQQFDPESLRKGFIPYTSSEVDTLRQHKLIKVAETRHKLVQKIENIKDQ